MNEISFDLFDNEELGFEIDTAIKKMYPQLENLHIVPSGETQTFKSKNYYGYDNVTVENIKLQNKELTLNKNGIYTIVADDNYSGLSEVEVTLDAIEDLDSELNTYQEELTEQETTVEELNELLQTKGIGEVPKYKPRVISFANYTGTDLDYELANLDTSEMITMESMFENCQYVLSVDLSKFNTSKVTNMKNMFSTFNKVTELDLRSFDTSNVTNMYSMFFSMLKVKKIYLNSFDTSNVTNMYNMFYGDENLQELDVTSFDTSNVTNMEGMFTSVNVDNLDLSSFDTSKVTNMRQMFYSYKAPNINVGHFNTPLLTSLNRFAYYSKIVNLNMGFDAPKVNNIQDIFNGATNLETLTFATSIGKGYTQKSNNYSNYKLDLSSCKNLTHDSLMDVINKLYDLNLTYNVANGGTLYTQSLTLGSTNKAKLTEEEIAIAVNKGWTVS